MRLVFIDEAGSHIGMTRDYARAPCGERAHGTVPRNRGDVTTMPGALDIRGVRALMTIEGARSQGLELDAQAMTRYAAETFQDPKVVKATCRKADETHRAIVERFDVAVVSAQHVSRAPNRMEMGL
jgi:hypothetical protein